MNVKEQAVHNAANIAMFMVNVALATIIIVIVYIIH